MRKISTPRIGSPKLYKPVYAYASKEEVQEIILSEMEKQAKIIKEQREQEERDRISRSIRDASRVTPKRSSYYGGRCDYCGSDLINCYAHDTCLMKEGVQLTRLDPYSKEYQERAVRLDINYYRKTRQP